MLALFKVTPLNAEDRGGKMGVARDYLEALGASTSGKVLVQNVYAALQSGRLVEADVRTILDEADTRWRGSPSPPWGAIDCNASVSLFNAIVSLATTMRFRGRPATGLANLLSFVVRFDRLIEDDRFVDRTELAACGISVGIRATRGLSETLAKGLNDGSLLKGPSVEVGAAFGIFWATTNDEMAVLVAQRGGSAAAVEQCGLYHMPPFTTSLLKFTSTETLEGLASTFGFSPATPTFVEGLNNLRFLGWDLEIDQPWGRALNLHCFRLSLDEITIGDLMGSNELALPALPFVSNFEVSVAGELSGYLATDDSFYGSILERVFGVDAHIKLGDALGLPV